MITNLHHIALSVRNMKESQAFYEKLGFKEVHRWAADNIAIPKQNNHF